MAAFAVVSIAVPASAVTRDHLQCFRISDEIAAAAYSMDLLTANLVIPPLEPGCTLKMPARLYCIDTATTNVTPPPPGGPVQQPAQAYLCYKAKCQQLRTFFTATDQFGAHDVSLLSTSLVGAPVQPLLSCGDGQIECVVGDEAICVDPGNDPANCGGCGIACPSGNSCVGGICQQNECSSLPCGECTQCAQAPGGACEDAVNAFLDAPGSMEFLGCIESCGDPGCLNMCVQAYPIAGQLYLAAAGCMMDACPDCGNSCGNGICDLLSGETALTCPSDCSGGVCGDGVCEPGEESTCPADCSVCGNGLCEPGEDAVNCGPDCPPVCGNGVCEANELIECPFDCYGAELFCNNGVDDDGDGLVDCEDPDCEADPSCAPGWEICDNGADDDGDGFVDCGDADCSGDPVCVPVGEICDNGADDDGDGLVDCGDMDCSADPVCAPVPCTPACSGRVCGDDGCGGSCGVCPASETCDIGSGTCIAN